MTVVIPENRSRRARKKAALRDHIMTVAIRLFSREGINAVTVDRIAEAADVGKGTIYNYFQTKEDIVVAFMVDVEHKVQARLGRFTQSKKPLHSVLAEFLLHQFHLKASYREFVRVFLGHLFLQTEQFIPYMTEIQQVVDPPLEALFRVLQERGKVRKDMNLPDLIMAFKTIHLGITALWVVEGPPFRTTERVLRRQMKLFSQGLEVRGDS
jgi:AcrR family transcriptional regulator